MKSFWDIKTGNQKNFDLNIDRILENWECKHAVREIIANALDEQILSHTQDIKIYKDGNEWIIRDYGRGLRIENLTQAENQEKLTHKGIIGKFGIGLKDALATFDRHNITVSIYSKFADISIIRTSKNGFKDIITLHATISPPSKRMEGTEVHLMGLSDSDMNEAKRMFLKFISPNILESTEFGEVIESNHGKGDIYINGVLVANEPNFLFSYNITKLDSILKKAINRERSNVGRTAYASTVRKILLNCSSEKIGKLLSEDLTRFSSGQNHDELKWIDVQTHAAKLIAKQSKAVFVTAKEIQDNIDLVKEADQHERKVIVIPDNLQKKIEETNNDTQQKGETKITTFSEFVKERSDNFQYKFSDMNTFSSAEKNNYNLIEKTLSLIGGKPSNVEDIRISETLQKDTYTFAQACGIWDTKLRMIIILREILANRSQFLGTLLHELAHARSGQTDATRGFEKELTYLLGLITSTHLSNKG